MEIPIHNKRNRAFQGAFKKGYLAFHDGKRLEENPYPDWRTYRGSVTYSRAFWRCWRAGFERAERDSKR
jgi:hypothetical protein